MGALAAGDADRVEVRVEHQRAPGRRAGARAMAITLARPSRSGSTRTSRPARSSHAATNAAMRRFARAARHEAGVDRVDRDELREQLGRAGRVVDVMASAGSVVASAGSVAVVRVRVRE